MLILIVFLFRILLLRDVTLLDLVDKYETLVFRIMCLKYSVGLFPNILNWYVVKR